MRENLLIAGAGLGLAVVLLGPALGPGSLLNLDLVATEHWPGPRAFWGLGPELGRALPFELAMSAVARVTSGSTAVKAFYVIAIATAFAGMHVQAGQLGLDTIERWAAALLYAGSPFLATRMGVGHLTMVAAIAILPWAQTRLLAMSDARSVVLAAAALSLTGFYGGLLAAVLLLAGSWGRSRRALVPIWCRAFATQLIWLGPGIVLVAQGTDLGNAANFPSGLSQWDAPLRLITGHGFWQSRFQVGGSTPIIVIAGGAVAVLGVLGYRSLSHDWSRRSLGPAVGATALILCDATPGLRTGVDFVTGLPGLSALREPQRLAPLLLLPLAVWVPVGARSLAGRVSTVWRPATRFVPLAIASVLLAPAVWGLDGQLDPVETPAGWHEARAIINDQPGTTVVLPWHRYLNVSFANERRVLNPALQFFGPNVVTSSDLELGEPTREAVEPREASIAALLPSIREGRPIGDDLAQLGVRWVLLTHDADYQSFLGLLDDRSLTSALVDRSIDLFEVDAWQADFLGSDGSPKEISRIASPLAIAGEGGRGQWSEPWMWGWMQGFDPVEQSAEGTSELTGSGRVLWYWPSLLVLAGYALWAMVVIRTSMKGIHLRAASTSDTLLQVSRR